MKRNCKNLLAGITTLAVLAWLTGCGQSHEKQAATPLKPPLPQEVEKAHPQTPQLEPVQVTQKIPGKLISGTAPNVMALKGRETASTPSSSRFHPVTTPKSNIWKPGPMSNFLRPSSSGGFRWAGLPACRPGATPWTRTPSIPWFNTSASCASVRHYDGH